MTPPTQGSPGAAPPSNPLRSLIADGLARVLAGAMPPEVKVRASTAFVAAGILSPAGGGSAPLAGEIVDLAEYIATGVVPPTTPMSRAAADGGR